MTFGRRTTFLPVSTSCGTAWVPYNRTIYTVIVIVGGGHGTTKAKIS
jgi:hypothetical protein